MFIAAYEKEVILLACEQKLHRSVVITALNHPARVKYLFRHGSYVLEIFHKELPTSDIFCGSVSAAYKDMEISFIVDVREGRIWLECFSRHGGVPHTRRASVPRHIRKDSDNVKIVVEPKSDIDNGCRC